MTLLTSHQAADALGVSVKAVHKMVQRGILPAASFGKSLAFTARDVEQAKRRPKRGRPKATAPTD